MRSAIAESTRTIILTASSDPDLPERIEKWLGTERSEIHFSIGELANPAREDGDPVQVLAVHGLPDPALVLRLLSLVVELLGHADRGGTSQELHATGLPPRAKRLDGHEGSRRARPVARWARLVTAARTASSLPTMRTSDLARVTAV